MSRSRNSSTRTRERGASKPTERPIRKARVAVRCADDDIGIADLLSLWRAAGVRTVQTLDCHETGAIVRTDVEERLPEERLAAIEYVDRWEHVSSTTDGEQYVIEFTAPNFPPSVAHRTADVIGTFDIEITDYGLTLTLVGAQSSIADAIEEYEKAGVAPDVRRLVPYDGAGKTLEELSERQREVLTTAYEMGYYEVPRETTAAAVAAEFDINTSTATEHLQRAERNLLSRQLSNELGH